MKYEGLGDQLRRGRIERNLSVEDVANIAAIPVSFVLHMESEEFDKLPREPMRILYIRPVAEIVGVDLPEVSTEEGATIDDHQDLAKGRIWPVRAAAIVMMMVMVFAIVKFNQPVSDNLVDVVEVESGTDEQEVSFVIASSYQYKVSIDDGPFVHYQFTHNKSDGIFVVNRDGVLLTDSELRAGRVKHSGTRSVVLGLPKVEGLLKVKYNGDLVKPQGQVDMPRTLRFIGSTPEEE